MNNETKWSIDPAHSQITFKVKHMMIANIRGTFTKFEADIHTTGKDFTTAAINLTIDPASVSTGDEKRDAHLRDSDFFETEKFKEITFSANTISKPNAEGLHEMWGELTIKGITKNVKLDVEFGGINKDPWGNERAGFTLNGKINRKDWELNWNSALEVGGVLVGDEVSINCEIQLINSTKVDTVMKLETEGAKK